MYLNPGIFRPKVKSIHSCILHGCLCQTQGETSVGFCQIDFLYAITTGPPEPAFFLHQLFLSKSLLWGFQVGCPSDWCSCIWWPYCDNPYFGNVMITPLRLATKGRSEATRVILDQASSGGEWDELGIIGNVGMLQLPRSHKTDALICRPIRSRKMSRQVEMEIWQMH